MEWFAAWNSRDLERVLTLYAEDSGMTSDRIPRSPSAPPAPCAARTGQGEHIIGGPMNEHDFEAQLKADGYTEIEAQTLEPRPGKGRHRHLFAIRGLVLSGTFNVTLDGTPVAHGPGQIFSVAEGQLHDESIGPECARILVGRKCSKPERA
jgi:quercetin dioxygenase-like cupin family protein